MKFVIKYPVTLLTLLLLGYTQAFAHIHREDFSAFNHSTKSHHFQAPVDKTIAIASDYFEEEYKRNLIKPYSKDNAFSDLFAIHVPAELFLQRQASFISGEHRSRFSLLTSLFRVLRL